jgi:hypothetical protein
MSSRIFFLAGIFASLLPSFSALAGTPPISKPNTGTAITSAQLSSAIDQNPGGIVKFELKDSVSGVDVTENSVSVKKPGSYLIFASPQVTATKDKGCIDAWIVLNGKDVPNSGVRLCQSVAGDTSVVVSQVVMKLKAGDTIQVKTAGKDVKLDAIKPEKGPLIPSIIFTVLGLI